VVRGEDGRGDQDAHGCTAKSGTVSDASRGSIRHTPDGGSRAAIRGSRTKNRNVGSRAPGLALGGCIGGPALALKARLGWYHPEPSTIRWRPEPLESRSRRSRARPRTL
jgi:hypothetical protein